MAALTCAGYGTKWAPPPCLAHGRPWPHLTSVIEKLSTLRLFVPDHLVAAAWVVCPGRARQPRCGCGGRRGLGARQGRGRCAGAWGWGAVAAVGGPHLQIRAHLPPMPNMAPATHRVGGLARELLLLLRWQRRLRCCSGRGACRHVRSWGLQQRDVGIGDASAAAHKGARAGRGCGGSLLWDGRQPRACTGPGPAAKQPPQQPLRQAAGRPRGKAARMVPPLGRMVSCTQARPAADKQDCAGKLP